tara:strand:+ start:32 stop:643 length:612 start_codon:yes stop_codon:yes gene_type:complete
MSKKSKKESTLYYFTSTGCAFCKQLDPIVEKLNESGKNILNLNISEPDNDGLKREIENKYDLRCGTPFLVDASNGNYICGYRDEETVTRWSNGEKIPPPPKPKGPPPPPPQDYESSEQVNTWKTAYQKWVKENDHMPNLPSVDETLDRLKKQQETLIARQNQANQGNPQYRQLNLLDNRIRSLESKFDIIENKIDSILDKLGV